MLPKLEFVCLILNGLFLIPTCTLEISQSVAFSTFIKKMSESPELKGCTTQLYFLEDHSVLTKEWLHVFSGSFYKGLMKANSIVLDSVRIPNITLEQQKYRQPEKVWHANRRVLVIVILTVSNFQSNTVATLKQLLFSPILTPQTIRNRDKFIILSRKNVISELQKTKFITEIKYLIVLEVMDNSMLSKMEFKIEIKQRCQYGLCGKEQTLVNVDFHSNSALKYTSRIFQALFPDQEKNFFGYTLRLSTTTKVPQLLELEIIDTNGKELVTAKRGLYAAVLFELSNRLNFTYEIVPSSGGGSTGHQENFTWVGTVGDTYYGRVHFGFMAAITFQRFPYAEFCAPINFAYIGFVTGPPRKSYPWNAILWPFNPVMWAGLSITVFIAAKVLTTLSNSAVLKDMHPESYLQKNMEWTYLKSIVFLVRQLLEQCPEVPSDKTTNSFRTFLTFWLLYSLVCSTVYKSKLTSLLCFPTLDRVPSTFDELAAATDFDVDFHYFGNVGYAYFKTSTNPTFVKIYKKMGREPNPLKCLQRTLHDKAACIIFIITYEELIHRNLSDLYGKTPLKFIRHEGAMFPAGVIHEHKSPLSSNFKSVLYPAMESGLIPFWQQSDLNQVLRDKNHWQKENDIDINSVIWANIVTDNLLRVKNLKGAFGILLLGTITALIFFALERLVKWEKIMRKIWYKRGH